MNPRLKTLLRWCGYVAGYVSALVFFAYLCFPYDRLRQYVVARYNAEQRGAYPNQLEIDELDWSWRFPGVTAEGVRLVLNKPPPAGSERKPPPEFLEAREIRMRVAPLALLMGTRELSFAAQALGGAISGSARESDDLSDIELELDGVNPGDVPQLAAAVGLPMSGLASGQIFLQLPNGSLAKADGNVDLSIDDLVVGDGKAKIQNTIALPELHMGTFQLKAQVDAGRLKIEECTSQGRDVDLTLAGELRLRRRVESSIANMNLEFRFSEKYKTQSDLTKALFGEANSKVPGLFDTATRSALAKLDDGGYASTLSGAFSRLRVRPRSNRTAAARTSTRRRSPIRRPRTTTPRRDDAAEARKDD